MPDGYVDESLFCRHIWSILSLMATYRASEPYNGLPLLPPLRDLESKGVLKAAISAHVALSDLRGGGACDS